MNSDYVTFRIEDNVATVTLDNPPLNVVTLGLTRALDAALEMLAADDQVRAVILTGSGTRAFCAGSDVSEFANMTQPGQIVPMKLERQNEVFNRLDRFPKPTIAAINGLAYGGGLEIALCCDLIVAERRSRLALPEIKLGVFPSSGGTFRTARRIGEARAKEMIFLGEPIDADTALAWGLINRVAEDGQGLALALDLARTLAQRPRLALSLAKSVIDLAFEGTEKAALQASFAASNKAFSSAECREGVRAFFARENPDFSQL
jgi:enoyl-CoA hydratase/carnithine racemase